MGLLSTLSLLHREAPLTVVGPEGIAEVTQCVPGLQTDWLPYEVRFVELEEGFEHAVVYEHDDYTVTARPVVGLYEHVTCAA